MAGLDIDGIEFKGFETKAGLTIVPTMWRRGGVRQIDLQCQDGV